MRPTVTMATARRLPGTQISGYGYGYSDPNYAQDPNYTNDPNSQPPGVLINRNYTPDSVTPVLRDYTNTPLPQPGPDYQGQTSQSK